MSGKARIGVIGAGWWVTENHLPILKEREDIELVAVCRRSRKELQRVKERFGIGFATDDYREMLSEVELDGVIVSSPHHLHHEHAKATLEQRLHVMVEKPMSVRTGDARELVRLAEQQECQILIPHGWNFMPYTREARRLVQQGAVGEIEHVVCQMASPRRAQYGGEAGTEGSMVSQDVSTYSDPERGGGYGWGQLVHALAMLFRITNLKAKTIFALMGRSSTGADFYDAISISFENGATGALSGSATVPSHRGYQLDLRLFGSEGMLLLDTERERLELRREDRRDSIYPMRPGDGEYNCMEPVDRFAEVCAGKEVENAAPGEMGIRCVEVLDAAYRSAKNGGLAMV